MKKGPAAWCHWAFFISSIPAVGLYILPALLWQCASPRRLLAALRRRRETGSKLSVATKTNVLRLLSPSASTSLHIIQFVFHCPVPFGHKYPSQRQASMASALLALMGHRPKSGERNDDITAILKAFITLKCFGSSAKVSVNVVGSSGNVLNFFAFDANRFLLSADYSTTLCFGLWRPIGAIQAAWTCLRLCPFMRPFSCS